MLRKHIWIEPEWYERIKSEMRNFGFSKPSQFIRYIIIKFFEKK
jgi:hypothetical protein